MEEFKEFEEDAKYKKGAFEVADQQNLDKLKGPILKYKKYLA